MVGRTGREAAEDLLDRTGYRDTGDDVSDRALTRTGVAQHEAALHPDELRTRLRFAGGGRRGAEIRRHIDLHDPGGLAAEFRRATRRNLCDDPFGGAVLQCADTDQSRQSGIDDRYRLRPVHRAAAAD